jgi:6-phosphogluconate dehydrogenase
MRHLSGFKQQREAAARRVEGPDPVYAGNRQGLVDRIENALYAAVLVTYAQGMALLQRASEVYAYGLDLETVARVWTGGCIIRAALLEEIQSAYRAEPGLADLLAAPYFNRTLQALQADLRQVVCTAAERGLPAPGLMMALAYWDACRSRRLPANLIMAQRDYFGSHTYERVDAPGTFHTRWGRG